MDEFFEAAEHMLEPLVELARLRFQELLTLKCFSTSSKINE